MKPDNEIYKWSIIGCTLWSLLMCNVVLYALHKTRDIWLRKKNTYVALTCMLMVINAIQNALLLGLRLIPPSLRYNDSGYCKVEGAILIVMNLINMWIIFFLSLESCLMIHMIWVITSCRTDFLKDLILHKTNRLRTYCILFSL